MPVGRARPNRSSGAAADAYRRFAPAVLGFLRAQRAPDPEDLLGEVFLQVARDLGSFKGDDDAFRRWIFTIAHHRLVDARRRQAARPQIADADVPEVADPAAGSGAAGLDPELLAALDELTHDQREVVVLRFVADLSIEDVARLTGREVGAVKSMQHRALAALARTLGPPPPDDG